MSCTPNQISANTSCLLTLDPHTLRAAWAALLCAAAPPTDSTRITEEGETRITEDGSTRIIEN